MTVLVEKGVRSMIIRIWYREHGSWKFLVELMQVPAGVHNVGIITTGTNLRSNHVEVGIINLGTCYLVDIVDSFELVFFNLSSRTYTSYTYYDVVTK